METIGYLESFNSMTASEVEFSGKLDFVQNAILKNSIYYDYTVRIYFKYDFLAI